MKKIPNGCIPVSTGYVLKMLLIMKFCLILSFVLTIQVFATDILSQKAGRIIALEDTDLKQVLAEIEQQTNYRFLYHSETVKDKTVKLDTKDKSWMQILDDISEISGLDYEVFDDNLIVLSKKNALQPITITGKVTSENGEPLVGLTVSIKGTTQGTITDVNGNYEIEVTPDVKTLVYNYVGMRTMEVAIENRTEINVVMETDPIALDEVLVVGYGVVKKSDLTGSVASVKNEEIDAYPTGNVLESLVGRATGVQILRSTGAPGPSVSMRIRGTNSIQGNNEPLYVIDGFPYSDKPTNLNNSDIESIEILKDASATAIYGSRGSNGVVIITTNAGKLGKPQVDFRTSYSIQSITKKLDLMNGREFAALNNIQAENDNIDPYFTEAEIESFGEGTDWQDLVLRNAPMSNTSININGGTEGTKYSVGGSIFKQNGIIKGSDYNRYMFRSKFSQDISKKITADVTFSYSHIRTNRKDSQEGARGTSLINASITAPPICKPYNDDGTINQLVDEYPFIVPDMTNPLNFIDEESDLVKANIVLGNAALIYRPIESLTIKFLGGIENRDDRNDVYQSRNFKNSNGIATVSTGQFTSLLSENTVSYNKLIADRHQIDAVGGFTYQNFISTGLGASGNGFLSDIFETYNLQAAATPGIPTSSYSEFVILSYLGRINYVFDNKYLATVSFRADGSSKYSENNKWGYFPSAALAWRLSEENFLRDNNVISHLKLRVSWGLTGSQAINPYATLNQLYPGNTVFGNELFTTFAPGTRLPADLKWETTEQIDIGMELGVLDNRLFVTADYYVKNTRDLLNTVSLPSSTGYTYTINNIGEVRNNGFEFGIDGIISSGNFKWDVYANTSINRNKVMKLAGGKDILTNYVGILILGDNVGILREGRPIGQFYGYLEDGYTEQGRIKYKDLNGDGSITADDKTYIGDPNPDFIYSLNSNMAYKNFKLNIFIQGTYGNDIFNVSTAHNMDFGQGENGLKEVFYDHWTPENPNAKYPIISRQASNEVSDRYVEDGSYLRLKNVELAYNIPFKNLGVNWIRNLELYVSGQNLITLTKYSWWDPEVNTRGLGTYMGIDHFSYPNYKSFTLGLRAGF